MTTPGKELEPLPPEVERLPAPAEFGRIIRDRLEAEIVRVRAERGEVVTAEDTFALTRSLQAFDEVMGEYVNAMTGARKIAKAEIQEELKYAVGEQDGMPLGGLTVPDVDGTDIKISLDTPNVHTIDQDGLYPVVVADVMGALRLTDSLQALAIESVMHQGMDEFNESTAKFDAAVAEALLLAQERVLSLGSFTPQVSKVRAAAKQLAAHGDDALAGQMTATIRTVRETRGIKVERKERK